MKKLNLGKSTICISILLIILLGMVIAYLCIPEKVTSENNNTISENTNTPEENEQLNTGDNATVDEDNNKGLVDVDNPFYLENDQLKSVFLTFLSSSVEVPIQIPYYNVEDGTTGVYTSMLYRNPTGESVTCNYSETVTISRDDNMSFYFGHSEEVAQYEDITFIDQLKLAIELAMTEPDAATIHTVDLTELYDGTVYEFIIDINGWDNVRKYYSYCNIEGYADKMVNSLEEQMETAGINPDENPVNMRFAYVINGMKLDSCGFYTNYSQESFGIDEEGWSNYYTNWYFEGYNQIGDWKLAETWYNTDNVGSEELNTMGVEVIQDITSLIAES